MKNSQLGYVSLAKQLMRSLLLATLWYESPVTEVESEKVLMKWQTACQGWGAGIVAIEICARTRVEREYLSFSN
jgi:hypothetical protein